MTSQDDDDGKVLVFGIWVDAGYRDIARLWYGDLRTWIEHGPKDLTPEDRARNEFVLALADHLRADGISNPIATAWDRVGTPDPDQFAKKLQPGQPLGDLSQQAVIDAFMPLVLSRLKYYGVAGNEDAKQAALVGLLTALRNYNPAVDTCVGTFAALYRHIDDAIKYEIRGKEGDAWNQNNVDGGQQLYDDEGNSIGDRWGVMPTTHLPDAIANGIDQSLDAQNRLHRSRIPDWVQVWAEETRVRSGFGAREEGWMDLPATPQEVADALAKIPADKIGRALGKLNEQEREIVVARFYRKPPILLSEIARGALNPKSKTSYKGVLNIAYRAVVKIAGQVEVKRPIRRPERIPDPPRQLPFRPWQPPTPIQALRRWLAQYEVYRWPFLDSKTLTVHDERVTKLEILGEAVKRLDNAPILVATVAGQKIKYRDNVRWRFLVRSAPPPFRIWFNGKVRVRTITIVFESREHRPTDLPKNIYDAD